MLGSGLAAEMAWVSDRAGRYRLDHLIEEHGPELGLPDLAYGPVSPVVAPSPAVALRRTALYSAPRMNRAPVR